MVFPVLRYGCKSWTIKKAESQRIDVFDPWCCRLPWTARRSNQSILKEINSVQFSRSVVSDSLWPHELQHARPPCPSPIPGAYPNSCPLSRWRHPTLSSSVVPFSCPQSFPASGCFQMSQLLASGGLSSKWFGLTSIFFRLNFLMFFFFSLTYMYFSLASLYNHCF